ncbi:DUF6477 family protein [Octadecabacter sp. 1_MG-2023]|uniref:DUF6477 family protein n=1 Tax=unclassified Octadecabacter TaxID=196158 RepID=UPI001C091EA1|nr:MULTISPECIES: DUF6477 family protein [unclassified Octadecabacter]MBU2993326.1 hypothetical protein [Octadecabacter sp. B2R22]MDO6733218.1 DUF6477 family protein [Octadecabacter sp. 1_MG-2023]
MEDVLSQISRLNRPTLLVNTARHGLEDYNRVAHLRRLLKCDTIPGPSQAIVRLMEIEGIANEHRLDDRAEYSIARHVELIVALMSEARILKASKAAKRRAALAVVEQPSPVI